MAAPEINRTLQANNVGSPRRSTSSGTPGFVVGDEVVPGAVSVDALRELIAAARDGKGK